MSGLIPQDQVDRANEDIVAVIGKHIDLKRTGKNWSARCPFHSEKSASFTVEPSKAFFYCFGCGASGNAIGFVMDYTGCSFPEAVESINGGIIRDVGGAVAPRKKRAVKCDLPCSAEDPESAAAALLRCAWAPTHAYLLGRNASAHSGCSVDGDNLVVPIKNNLGDLVNAAIISPSGQVHYAAGKPTFGGMAFIEPLDQHDGETIICHEYAYAHRIWMSRCGKSKVICGMGDGNLAWSIADGRIEFTRIACDPLEAEFYEDYGHKVVLYPVDPYAK